MGESFLPVKIVVSIHNRQFTGNAFGNARQKLSFLNPAIHAPQIEFERDPDSQTSPQTTPAASRLKFDSVPVG
jgi:hypothetical protein